LLAPDHKFLLKYTNVNIYVNFGVREREFSARVLIQYHDFAGTCRNHVGMVSKSLPQSFKNGQFLVQSLLFAHLEYAAMDKLSIDFDVLKKCGIQCAE